MELKEILNKRRSMRKYNGESVSRETLHELMYRALKAAPSAKNTRSTHLIAVDNRETVAKLSQMRDFGTGFLVNATAAIVVAGDPSKTTLWVDNCAIVATLLQLTAVDMGLGSCWVHVCRRPRVKAEPQGETAEQYLRTLVDIPENLSVECIIAVGYSDYQPKPLSEYNPEEYISFAE